MFKKIKPILVVYIGVSLMENNEISTYVENLIKQFKETHKEIFKDYHVLFTPVKGESRIQFEILK